MISKLKLYENVVIGNFLYGLGFAVRAKSDGRTVPSMINLLQQTPADKRLADVLLEFPGVARLIEFKQQSNKSKKEIDKLRLLKSAIGQDSNIIELSKSIHWFIETAPEKQSFISRVAPYLDLDAASKDRQQHSFGQFIEEIAENAVDAQPKFSREDLQYYLSFLAASFQGSGNVGTGGLLLVINAEGSLTYAVLTDILQLRLQHKDYVKELTLQMQQASEQEFEQKQTNEKHYKGPSL